MENRIKSILKSFAIRSVILFITWLIAYYGFIEPQGTANAWLTSKVTSCTKIGLNVLGYDTSYNRKDRDTNYSEKYIYINNQPVVSVADPCNGLELIALFIGFLLAFPGPWKWKVIFMSIGSVIIFIINVIREIVLALNYKYFQQTFDFNHKYTYVFIVYLIIFLIWRFWLNKWSAIGSNIRSNAD